MGNTWKPCFRPNPKMKLMDQGREVLRYHLKSPLDLLRGTSRRATAILSLKARGQGSGSGIFHRVDRPLCVPKKTKIPISACRGTSAGYRYFVLISADSSLATGYHWTGQGTIR